jgi:hypothetical protein
VRFAALASVLGMLTACAPVATPSSIIVTKVDATEALVRTTDDLSPGDAVHIWRLPCRRPPPAVGNLRCGYRYVGEGLVTMVVLDPSDYALVQFAPGANFAVGDRAVKDSPMSYWHPAPPPQ